MARYLAIFNDTIGDIEINGFTIITDRVLQNFEELASSITWDFVYKIGYDELRYSNGEDLLSRFEFKEINNDDFKVLKRLFDGNFGTFVNEDYLEKVVNESEDTISDDDDDEGYSGYSNNDDEDDFN